MANFLHISDDIFGQIIMYISNSHRNILLYREHIFCGEFKLYVRHIYNNAVLRKLYTKFFIEFWELPEVQRNAELIFSTFKQCELFRKTLLHKSLYHDDVELFNKCIMSKPIEKNIVRRMQDYSAWNIMLYLAEHALCKFAEYKIFDKLWDIKNNKIPVSSLSIGGRFVSKRFWLLSDVYNYYTVHTSMQYIPSKIESAIIRNGVTKYKFNMDTRNILKYMLLNDNKMEDSDVHNFLMLHNNMSLMYEYLTIRGIFKCGVDDVADLLIHKLRKGRNILTILFQYKCLIALLYEKIPTVLFKYLVGNYAKLHANDVDFLLNTIFGENHRVDFYRIVSSSSDGNLTKKDRKHIYRSIRQNTVRINPSLVL